MCCCCFGTFVCLYAAFDGVASRICMHALFWSAFDRFSFVIVIPSAIVLSASEVDEEFFKRADLPLPPYALFANSEKFHVGCPSQPFATTENFGF